MIFDKRWFWIIIGFITAICIFLLLINTVFYDSQVDCCCSGVVSRPCVCILPIDCIDLACGDRTDFVPICCNRWVNCSTKDWGQTEIWYGNPLTDNPQYVELEQKGIR